MKQYFGLHCVVPLLCVSVVGVGMAWAQASPTPPPTGPVEVWGGFNALNWPDTGRLDSSYRPYRAAGHDASGLAGQTLVLDPAMALGFEAGGNVFVAPHVGVQTFLAYSRADLEGENGPYELDLSYISRQPPDYVAVGHHLTRSLPWPDTRGHLSQWTVGLGPVVGWRTPRVGVTASGGIAWLRLSGEAESLGYTAFRMGGHAVLFSDDYDVRVSLEQTTTTAGYLGGAVDVAVGRHAALTLGVRAIIAGDVDIPTKVDAVSGGTSGLSPPSAMDVQLDMAPGPVRLSPQGVGFTIGVKIR